MVIGTPTVLNLIPGKVFPVVNVNQYDEGYQHEFLLYKGTEPFNIESNMSVTIRGTKGDRKGITKSVSVTVGSNLVKVMLTKQMTAVVGQNNYELRIVNIDGLIVGTVNFIMVVEPSALDDDTVISDSELSYAEDVLDKLQSVEAIHYQVQRNKEDIASEIHRATTAEENESDRAITAEAALQEMIVSESATRTSETTNLQSQINQYVVPSTQQPDEVVNARVGEDCTTYSTLGDAVRTQIGNLRKAAVSWGESADIGYLASMTHNGYQWSSDQLTENGLMACTDYIRIPSDAISVRCGNKVVNNTGKVYRCTPNIVFYDSSYVRISSLSNANDDIAEYDIPENATYIRVNQPSKRAVNNGGISTIIFTFRKLTPLDDFDHLESTLNIMEYPSAVFTLINGRQLKSDGTVGEAANRAASLRFFKANIGDKIVATDGYLLTVAVFASADTSALSSIMLGVQTAIVQSNGYVRLGIRRADDAVMADAELNNAFTYYAREASHMLISDDILKNVPLRQSLYVDDEGVYRPAIRMGVTAPIPVIYGHRYVFGGTYDDTRDGTQSVNRIVALNANEEFMSVIHAFTLGGDNAVKLFNEIVVIDNPAIKYISLSYAYRNCTSARLTTYGGFEHDNAVVSMVNSNNVKSLKAESYAIKKNSPAMVRELIDVALSYVGQKDKDGNYVLRYGNKTPLQNNYENDNSIDCSTFIGFALRGIPYSKSPYGRIQDTPDYDYDEGEGTDNTGGEDGEYDYKQWGASDDYLWSFNPAMYNLTLEYDITAQYPTTTDPMYFVVRRASQVAQCYAQLGREVPIDEKLNNIEVGDIVFWSRKKANGTWLQPYRYKYINHIALVISKEKATASDPWDINKHPFKHTYIEVTNPGAGKDVVHTNILELEGNEYSNNVNTLSCVVRPDLGAINVIGKKDETNGVDGELRYDANNLYICVDGEWKKIALLAD